MGVGVWSTVFAISFGWELEGDLSVCGDSRVWGKGVADVVVV